MKYAKEILLVLFGVGLFFIILTVLFEIAGFFISNRLKISVEPPQDGDSFKIICIGESTTAMGGQYSYPNQLETILNDSESPLNFTVINKGIPGHSTTSILEEIETNLAHYQPDMVVSMTGINDGTIWANQDSSKQRPFWLNIRLLRFLDLFIQNLLNERRNVSHTESDDSHISLKSQELASQGWRMIEEAKDFPGAIRLLEQALDEDDQNTHALVLLGIAHTQVQEFAQAITRFKQAERLKPNDIFLRDGLIEAYTGMKARAEIQKLLTLQLKERGPIFLYFGPIDNMQKSLGFQETEQILKEIAQDMPGWSAVDLSLAYLYFINERPALARSRIEQFFAQQDSVEDVAIYGFAGQIYQQLGLHNQAKDFLNRSASISMQPITVKNYQRLRDAILARGLTLVAVQYPVRRIEPLKQLLGENPAIVYVDNEKLFKKAIQTHSYDYLFQDSFAGDFGHATPEGNRILANNIATAILNHLESQKVQ